jgi:hypothetical protein
MAAKGKTSKTAKASSRAAEENRLSADAPLKRKRICCDCGGEITRRGDFEPVRLVAAGGKARMKARHKGGCKRAA